MCSQTSPYMALWQRQRFITNMSISSGTDGPLCAEPMSQTKLDICAVTKCCDKEIPFCGCVSYGFLPFQNHTVFCPFGSYCTWLASALFVMLSFTQWLALVFFIRKRSHSSSNHLNKKKQNSKKKITSSSEVLFSTTIIATIVNQCCSQSPSIMQQMGKEQN